ncbi:MAG: TatD family hydrolase [Bacteroidia bacterium]
MKYIDTHSHLYAKQFEKDQAEVIRRAKNTLEAVYLPNIDLDSIAAMHDLTEKDPQFFFPMMGLHPCSVDQNFEQVLAKMESYFAERQYYGIGETGIDLHWDTTYAEEQKAALLIQVDWAKKYNLPLILHCRKALDLVIEMMEKEYDENLKGIFHCFDGTVEQAKRIEAMPNFKMGIGGVVTYKTSTLPEVLSQISVESLVLETDSPYLPPHPHRGKRNESSYTLLVAEKLADIYDLNLLQIGKITNENAMWLFTKSANN